MFDDIKLHGDAEEFLEEHRKNFPRIKEFVIEGFYHQFQVISPSMREFEDEYIKRFPKYELLKEYEPVKGSGFLHRLVKKNFTGLFEINPDYEILGIIDDPFSVCKKFGVTGKIYEGQYTSLNMKFLKSPTGKNPDWHITETTISDGYMTDSHIYYSLGKLGRNIEGRYEGMWTYDESQFEDILSDYKYAEENKAVLNLSKK